MRVITRFGFGTVEKLGYPDSRVKVQLDEPFFGQETQVLERLGEIFPWGNWAIVRVVSTDRNGIISNIQFYPLRGDAWEELQKPGPSNETKFLLDFETGQTLVNHELGILAQEFIVINPWIDRWAMERTELFEEEEEAITAFGERLKKVVSGAGVCASLLLDVREKLRPKLLWLYVLVEGNFKGPIFEKKFF